MARINGRMVRFGDFEASQDITAGDDIISTDDIIVGDDITLASGGIITNSAGQLVINPTTYTSVGTGSPGVATAAGDLYVQDAIECDGDLDIGGQLTVATTINQGVNQLLYNAHAYGAIMLRNTAQTVDSLVITSGTNANHILFVDHEDRAFNFAHTQQTNPTIYGHSANQSTTEWWSITHDQTNGVIATGAGGIDLQPAGNVLFTAGAAQKIDITATATEHTDTTGLIDLDMTAGATGVVAIDSLITAPAAGLSSDTIYNVNLNCNGDDNDDSSSYIVGLHATADAVGSAKKWGVWVDSTNWEHGIYTDADVYLNDTHVELNPSPASNTTSGGIKMSMTIDSGASPAFGSALFMAADGELEDADADADTTMPCVALALGAGTGAQDVHLYGPIRQDTWNWTIGAGINGLIYVDTTTGALTQTAPSGSGDQVQIVGWAISADIMFFNPSYDLAEIA